MPTAVQCPCVQDEEGNTALHLAATQGHVIPIFHLLKKGGESLAAVTNKQGKTARDLAMSQREEHMAKARLASRAIVALDSRSEEMDKAIPRK